MIEHYQYNLLVCLKTPFQKFYMRPLVLSQGMIMKESAVTTESSVTTVSSVFCNQGIMCKHRSKSGNTTSGKL